MALQIAVITLFPEIFGALNYGIVGRAIKQNQLEITCLNPRDFTQEPRTIDDRPYGGGPGMVMKFEPLHTAIQAAKNTLTTPNKVIHLSPQGKRLSQEHLLEEAKEQRLILIAGRYEGIDERLIEADVDEEWSIGDYVLSGGEFPAMVIIDALTRLLPGTLGHEASALQDSFASGLLDYPQYTRPETVDGRAVPEVLLSGDHRAIARWRLKQALGKTWQKRQDLIKRRTLTPLERELLEEYIREEET